MLLQIQLVNNFLGGGLETVFLQCFDAVGWASGRASGFAFLVPAHLGSPGQRAVKRVWLGNSVGVAWCVWAGL